MKLSQLKTPSVIACHAGNGYILFRTLAFSENAFTSRVRNNLQNEDCTVFSKALIFFEHFHNINTQPSGT